MQPRINMDRQAYGGRPRRPVHQCSIPFAALVFLWTASAAACDTPVFQYAFENWPLDPYELIVFHRSAPEAEIEPIVHDLEANAGNANVRVTSVDVVDDMDESVRRLWESLCAREAAGGDAAATPPELPLMALCYPQQAPALLPVWSAAMDEAHEAALFDSPARTEVVKSLQQEGCVAVWILLESGVPAKDAAAERLLKEQFTEMSRLLDEPTPTAAAPGPAVPATPAAETATPTTAEPGIAKPHLGNRTFSFPMLKISRDDPAEQVFIQMLLHSEPDLRTFDAPMAFPIYGRGRILYALVGDGINADTIGETYRFLMAGCSCVIKAQNPGTDLLLTAVLPADTPAQQDAPPLPQVASVQPLHAPPPLPDPLSSALWSMLAGLSIALVLAVAASIVIALRPKNES